MLYSKHKTVVYLFPGQAADERLFSKIKLNDLFQLVHIVYPEPKKGLSLKMFAKEISKQVKEEANYIFIGVSIGGMICSELCEYLHPQKVIVISSAKYSLELPLRYRIQKLFPINRIIPKEWIKKGALFLQPLVEPDRNKYKETFNSMMDSKTPSYYKQTVNMILNWDKSTYKESIIHIHGNNDRTLPIKNVKANYIIEGGSHAMTLTRGEEINELILKILSETNER